MNAREEFRDECSTQNDDLKRSTEGTDSLREIAEELRAQIKKTKDEESENVAASAENEAAQQAELTSLRMELTEAVEARHIASEALAAQHQAETEHRNDKYELSLSLAGIRVAAKRLSRSVQDAKSRRSSLRAELSELRCGVAAAQSTVTTQDAAHASLEAELQQQREATLSWQACVDNLAQGHHAISAESATLVHASHRALCSGPVQFEDVPHWLSNVHDRIGSVR